MKALVIVRWLLFHMFFWHGIAEQVLLNREHFNKKMVGQTIFSLSGLSLSACIYGCMVWVDCQSFNFDRNTNICDFNNADSSTALESLKLATSGRVLYSDISVWPQVWLYVYNYRWLTHDVGGQVADITSRWQSRSKFVYRNNAQERQNYTTSNIKQETGDTL